MVFRRLGCSFLVSRWKRWLLRSPNDETDAVDGGRGQETR